MLIKYDIAFILFDIVNSPRKAVEDRSLRNIPSLGEIILEGWVGGEKSRGYCDG